MQHKGKNMADVRKELGVKSVRRKIEKRVLERIGHVMRMEDDRMTKALVLGWMEDLEKMEEERKSKKDGLLLEEAVEGSRSGLHEYRMADK